MLLNKTLSSHSASFHREYKWVPDVEWSLLDRGPISLSCFELCFYASPMEKKKLFPKRNPILTDFGAVFS